MRVFGMTLALVLTVGCGVESPEDAARWDDADIAESERTWDYGGEFLECRQLRNQIAATQDEFDTNTTMLDISGCDDQLISSSTTDIRIDPVCQALLDQRLGLANKLRFLKAEYKQKCLDVSF